MKLTVPEDLSGEQQLKITTDAGTEALLPVTVAEKAADQATEDPKPTDQPKPAKEGSSDFDGSSFGLGFGVGISTAVVAAVAALSAAVGFVLTSLPAPLQQMIERLRQQYNI